MTVHPKANQKHFDPDHMRCKREGGIKNSLPLCKQKCISADIEKQACIKCYKPEDNVAFLWRNSENEMKLCQNFSSEKQTVTMRQASTTCINYIATVTSTSLNGSTVVKFSILLDIKPRLFKAGGLFRGICCTEMSTFTFISFSLGQKESKECCL